MANGMPELGSKISLISKADIRYEGRLFTVDPQECTIALANVRSFGTEDRETQYPIAPQSQIYDYILFRGSDIKDIRVVNNSMPHPTDPAIMQMQLPNGQHLMPLFPPMQAMNTPMGNYHGTGSFAGPPPNTGPPPGVGLAGGAGLIGHGIVVGGSAAANHGAVTVVPTSAGLVGGTGGLATNNSSNNHDLLAGASRSTTPISLLSRKSPSADMAVQVNQNAAVGSGNRDAGHKRQNQPLHQQHRAPPGMAGNNMGGGYNRDRRDSGRHDPQNQHYPQQYDNRNHYNNQRNNQNRGGWMNRNNNMNNNNMMNMRNNNRGRGNGRMPNQGYRQPFNGNMINNKSGRVGPGGKPTFKFDDDFDFEKANTQFEELLSSIVNKLKVSDDPKTEAQVPYLNSESQQVNGETEKKDDSGNETGAGEQEHEEEVICYDKTKSFFDSISCEAAQDRSKNKKNDWRQERKLNTETFGIPAKRVNYRGRGSYYNRNVNSYNGGYNRGYRQQNGYNNRNRNYNNRQLSQSTGIPIKSQPNQISSNINPGTPTTGSSNTNATATPTQQQITKSAPESIVESQPQPIAVAAVK